MSKVFVPTSGPSAWKAFLADPEKHWVKGRSARTLAHCWEDASGFPPEILATLEQAKDFTGIEPLLVLPEWKVPLPGGVRPSQNDAWVLARSRSGLVSIAVEGKVDEPFDRTVKEWSANASPGKVKRLSYLSDCLGLASSPPGHIYYQLLHRTASAVIEAERFHADAAVMLVHSFSHTDQWFAEYQQFCELFSVHGESGVLGKTAARGGLPLYLGWVHGDERYLAA